ncbi:MAG TPA: hypothetical protein ENK66_02735 [Arcobacter sp.]|jgi:hypothetical protein|nr:hypothetical protein [Arcobacter sp.]
MNKTNPLFIFLGSIIILFIVVFSLFQSKKELVVAQDDFKSFEVVASEFSQKSRLYTKKTLIEKRIEKIIKKVNLANVKIDSINKKITISIQENNQQKLQNIVNKILNETFNITKFKLSKTSLIIEIGVL